jgi:hypothetical protein
MPWNLNNVLCAADLHMPVNNINTEHVAMELQQCILLSIVTVKLETFHYVYTSSANLQA